MRDFINSRVVGGKQQIKTSITFHTYAELILWPYGYTYTDIPSDMTQDDHGVFVAMGQYMAGTNGYTPQQSSDLYITDGTTTTGPTACTRSSPTPLRCTRQPRTRASIRPPRSSPRQTSRNDAAVRYIIQQADCPYRTIGKEAQYCARPRRRLPQPIWRPPPSSSSQINLAWTDNDNNETGFKIERCTGAGCTDFTQIATVAANVTSYANTGLSAPPPATATACAPTTRPATRTIPIPPARRPTQLPPLPAAPTGLTATAISKSQINLTWTDNATNENGFRIERCKGSTCTNFAQIATVGANVTTFANTGLSKNTTYRYRVVAYNASGTSAYSNIAVATTLRR